MTSPVVDRRTRKYRAILDAATEVFFRTGYAGSSMEQVTVRAGVSKQTVYAYFRTKEALFVEVVADVTRRTTASVHDQADALPGPHELVRWLEDYGLRQLTAVLEPTVVGLRRLAVSEADRFPELAATLWAEGPAMAIAALSGHLRTLAASGLLVVPDPGRAAQHLNWLIMGQALNEAMLLGGAADTTPERLRADVRAAVATFLAAYRPREDRGAQHDRDA
jgi:TetR/AcrR family transcriptional repressor of mexJK operon